MLMAVEFIDFSCKHDVLIRNNDGSLRPMDEPYFENEQIDADTWRVLSSGDYCYIVRGEGAAFAIDCGYGAGNIRKYMESVAGVPVPCVVNSHDHFDHTCCNAYFDKAYMSELCVKYATVPFPSFEGIDFHADEYERIAVKDGDIIPLPGRELVAIQVVDHAPTSMMYLDRKNRILFSGDEIFGMPFKPLSGGLTSWVKGLGKIKAVWDDFDVAYGGNTTLIDLFNCLRDNLARFDSEISSINPVFRENRAGDIPYSQASIDKARQVLGYAPKFDARQGFMAACEWYWNNLKD